MQEIDRVDSALAEGFNPRYWKDVPIHCRKCHELSDETHPSDDLCPECHLSENVKWDILDDFDCPIYSVNDEYCENQSYQSYDNNDYDYHYDNDKDIHLVNEDNKYSMPVEIFEMYYGSSDVD